MYSTYRNIHSYSASSINDEDELLFFFLFYHVSVKNFCHLFGIGDADCLDEVYSMLLCRLVCLLSRKGM